MSGWYRMTVVLPEDVNRTVPLGLLIPNSSGMLGVFWNGEYLGGSVPLTGAGVPIVAGPLMLTLPASLATPGKHTILLRYTGTEAVINFVRAPRIGYEHELRPVFTSKKMTLVYLPLVLGGFSVVAALIFFAAYRRDPSARGVQFLTAGLLAASWSVVGFYLSFPEWMAGVTERLRPMPWGGSALLKPCRCSCRR